MSMNVTSTSRGEVVTHRGVPKREPQLDAVILGDRRERCSKCGRLLTSNIGGILFPLERDELGAPKCKDGNCRRVKD